jgi:hypothetical protein
MAVLAAKLLAAESQLAACKQRIDSKILAVPTGML